MRKLYTSIVGIVAISASTSLTGCSSEMTADEKIAEACRIFALAQESPLSSETSNQRFEYYEEAAILFRSLSVNNSEFTAYARALSSSAVTKGGGLYMEDFVKALGFCGLA